MATRSIDLRIAAAVFCTLSLGTAPAWAQSQSAATPVISAPPAFVQVTGTFLDGAGQPLPSPLAVAFAVYNESAGGTRLWREIHTVTLDARGRYSILLGSATEGGIPAGLFATADARWLGVQPDGAEELPRTLWTSVPYALKAGDATTLGGLPASAFLQRGGASMGTRVGTSTTSASTSITRQDPGGIAPLDVVVADDQIVQGSICVGLDCVDAENFGFDTLRLKENNTRLQFFDTSVSAGFATNNWQIRANASATDESFLAFVDQGADGFSETGTIVFRVDAGAPAHAMRVMSTGETRLRNGNDSFTHFNYAGTSTNYIRGATYFDAGNVGIGTSAPAARLQVNGGEMRLQNGNGSFSHFNYAGGSENYLRGTTYFDSAPVYFTGGNIGIGTTVPVHPLQMGSGAHVTVGGVWTDASSRTLKDNIAPLPLMDAEGALAALQPVSFVYKSDPADSHVGFIAEDVPELVATPDRRSLAPMDIVAVLTKVLQNQQTTINELKDRLAQLERQMAAARQQ